MQGQHMEIYFLLAPQLLTQDEPAYCGLSSLVMVLNALAVDPGAWVGVLKTSKQKMRILLQKISL